MARKKSKLVLVKSAPESAADIRRREIHTKWCRLNPDLAAAERALRLRQLDLEERSGHKRGTAATYEAAQVRREGAMVRLYMSGAISPDELGAAEEIAAAAERIGAAVGVRTMSMETRIDQGRQGDGTFWEGLGQVRRERAYRRWREALGNMAPAIEDMIVRDIGLVETAAKHRIGVRRLRKTLIDALGAWGPSLRWARDWINDDDLNHAHARLA
jgi:hypothetical protein